MKAKKLLLLSGLFALVGASAAVLTVSRISSPHAVGAAVVEEEPAGTLHLEETKIKGYTSHHFETMQGHDGNEVTAYVFGAEGNTSVNPEVRFVDENTQTTTKPYTLTPLASVTNVHFWYKLDNQAPEKNVADGSWPYLLQVLGSDGLYPLHSFTPVNDGEWHPWLMTVTSDYVEKFCGFIIKMGDMNGTLTVANIELNVDNVDIKDAIACTGTSWDWIYIDDHFANFNFGGYDIFNAKAYFNDHMSEFKDADGNQIDLRNGIVINGKSFGYWIDLNASATLYTRNDGIHSFPINAGGTFNPVSIEYGANDMGFKFNLEYFPMLDTTITFKAGIFRGYCGGVTYELSEDVTFKSTFPSTDTAEYYNRTFVRVENLNETPIAFQIEEIDIWDDRYNSSGASFKLLYFKTNVKRPSAITTEAWWADHYRYLFDDILLDGKPMIHYNSWLQGNYKDYDSTWAQNPAYETEHPTGSVNRNFDTGILPSLITDQANYQFFIRMPYQFFYDYGIEFPTFSIREGACWQSLDADNNPIIARNTTRHDYVKYPGEQIDATFTSLSVEESENGTGFLNLNTDVDVSAIGYNMSDKPSLDYMLHLFKVNGRTLDDWRNNPGVEIAQSEYAIGYFDAYGYTDGVPNASRLTKAMFVHANGSRVRILVHPKLWAILKTQNLTVTAEEGIRAYSDNGRYARFLNSFSGTTDDFHLNDLVNNYLHMSDYNENLGYCSDAEHAYYANAKDKFNGMSATARERFVSEAAFVDAYARLQAWATINGDNVTSGGISSLGHKIMPFAEETSYAGLIIVMSISALALGGFFFLKKKRQH